MIIYLTTFNDGWLLGWRILVALHIRTIIGNRAYETQNPLTIPHTRLFPPFFLI